MNIADLWSTIRNASGLNNTAEAKQAFMAAVNFVIADFNSRLRPTTDYDKITDVTGTLDVPEYTEAALFAGIKKYLHDPLKAWISDPDPEAESSYIRHFGGAMSAAINQTDDFKTRNQADAE